MKDPKKLAGIIIAAGKPKDEEEEVDNSSEEKEEGSASDDLKEESAKDAFDAIKDDDFEKFKSALSDYVEACMG